MSELSPPLSVKGKPREIIWFAVTYIGFALVALANNLWLIAGIQSELSAILGAEAPWWLALAAFGFRCLVRLFLVWLVVSRASKLARWVILVIAVPWLFQASRGLPALLAGDIEWALWAVSFVLQFVAIGLLFSRGSRLWFARRDISAGDVIAT